MIDEESSAMERKAGELAEAFETRTRGDGDDAVKFYTLKDGSPQWMTDVVRAAHGDFLPDDWRYRAIASAAEALAEGADDVEWSDEMIDTYGHDLLRWLSSNLNRAYYCDEALEEGLVSPFRPLYDRIGAGQYVELREVWGQLVEALREQVEEGDDDDV